ncbi:MAG: HD domain-containing protein [Patescibacteria group bacterium]|nr:phosphohydrolase [Patescibacteria group bacterium]
MPERSRLLEILNQEVENKNIIKHMFAAEACMAALAREIKNQKSKIKKEEVNEEKWAFAGLMHDGDYKDSVPIEKQGIEIVNILKKQGIEVPDSVAHAMAAHNWHNTGVEPKSLMDWTLFICDSLTGLIVACALVRPEKRLATVTVDSVLKKFPDKRFAAGTRREEIKLCQEKLGIPLEEFVKICLEAMQAVSDDLGL